MLAILIYQWNKIQLTPNPMTKAPRLQDYVCPVMYSDAINEYVKYNQTMTNQLKEKEMTKLSEVIHLYLGCECLNNDNLTYTLKPSHFPSNWRDSDCPHKLILRSLSDMTDVEESVYMDTTKCAHVELRSAKQHAIDILKIDAIGFLFLLKQGFDLFDLITTGQAINKTTLNK